MADSIISAPTVEVIRRIYDNGSIAGGAFIEVGPDGDGLSLVQVNISGKSAEFFGSAHFTMSPQMAMKLGEALCAAAREAR